MAGDNMLLGLRVAVGTRQRNAKVLKLAMNKMLPGHEEAKAKAAEAWEATLRATEKAELADRLQSEVKQAFGMKKPLFGGRALVCEPCVSLR